MTETPRVAADVAEAAARSSYGKLLAILAARSGDIAAAEDALADAFAAALATWPLRGVPDNPEAWLLVAARRNLGHARARRATADAGVSMIELLERERADAEAVPFGDERLKLLFVCASPAISQEVQAPLMLQTVLGLDSARIAGCFLVSPDAMRRQLVRAKAKIRAARVPFAVPDVAMISDRVDAVLSTIYAAYGAGWDDVVVADCKNAGLASEALWLGRLVVELMPGNAEALGLLSLMLHCEARQGARRDAAGRFVPLTLQDVASWSRPLIVEAEATLRLAARQATPGRFQTEAAIQSLHAQQRLTGERLGPALRQMYDVLVALSPSIGARLARAVAYAETGAVSDALDQLSAITNCNSHQPWHAARARILWLANSPAAARDAARTAAGLASDPAVRSFLLEGRIFE